ncbi:hypothetical protein KCU93_g4219, partial [Aureobasidium melanogenum]
MVSFYLENDPTSTMNTKTNDFTSISDAEVMYYLISPESRSPSPSNGTTCNLAAGEDASMFHPIEVQPKTDDWIDVNTPSYSQERHVPERTLSVLIDKIQPSMDKEATSIESAALDLARRADDLAKAVEAGRDFAKHKGREIELAAAKECEQVKTATKLAVREKAIVEQQEEIARLNTRLAELEEVSQLSSTKHISDCPIVMRIDVWVGGEDGTDVELALVKMNPDTPFKIVLETLRDQHPLKALKQKSTGRWIFDSDTPASLGFRDGEELVFIQQHDEPMFMLDASMDETTCWRGKDSRVSWREPEGEW